MGAVVDNMAGLKSAERKNAGALRPLLDDVIMGMDPEEGIEEEYKVSGGVCVCVSVGVCVCV